MTSKGDDEAARGGRPPHGAGGRHEVVGAGAAVGAPARATPGQRWLAGLAFGAAFAVVVVLLSGALRSVTVLLLGFAGLAITCAAAWWFLANRGIRRWLALSLRVQVPRNRPGVPEPRPPMDWAQLRRQALTFTRATGGTSGAREKTS